MTMNINLPCIPELLFAQIVDNAPGVMQRRIKKNPLAAEEWTWSDADNGVTITTENDDIVTVNVDKSTVNAINCNCLMAPKCFHVLACAFLISVKGSAAPSTAEVPPTAPDDAQNSSPSKIESSIESSDANIDDSTYERTVKITEAMQAFGNDAHQVFAALLKRGLNSFTLAELSTMARLLHRAKTSDVPSLASLSGAIMQSIGARLAGQSQFSLEEYTRNLALALRISFKLSIGGQAPLDIIGTARRKYNPGGGLDLMGIFCEAAGKGTVKGVLTWFSAPGGRFLSLGTFRSDEDASCEKLHRTGIDFGGMSLSPRDLAKKRIIVSNAAISEENTLSQGKSVKAAAANPMVSSFEQWSEWIESLGHAGLQMSNFEKNRTGIIFAKARVEGLCSRGIVLTLENPSFPVRATYTGPGKPETVRNAFRLLGSNRGLELLIAFRIIPASPTIDLLAVFPQLPEASDGHRWHALGLDSMDVISSGPHRDLIDFEDFPGFESTMLKELELALTGIAMSGADRITAGTLRHLDDLRKSLERHIMPAGADILSRFISGTGIEKAILFSACVTWLEATSEHFRQQIWSPPS
ncbi:hypothetical protein KKF34_15575 [Myxococcota bacterium]|nr:hypothetical protein [Myxococcota bacterium]MBU1498295.1 hypothetical protein [Myxococcota bacterium]